MVKASDLAQVGYKYIGRSYKEMDCQKFVERCLKDCGNNTDLKGSNAWYRKMTWVGSPEECVKKFGKVPPGAFLFIHAFDGGEVERGYHDGLGNASHIGIVTGSGKGAIHSSQSRGGVRESEFKGQTIKHGGWNKVGLWNQVDYGDKVNKILSGGREAVMSEYATVFASTGSTANLRASNNSKSARLAKVPIGTKVRLLDYGEKWCQIEWNGKQGYMMTEFLIIGDVTPGEPVLPDDMIEVSRSELEKVYVLIGDMLGVKG